MEFPSSSVALLIVVAAIVLLTFQALTIAALVLLRARRRESEARTAAMLNAGPDTMFLVTINGVFVDYRARGHPRPGNGEPLVGRHIGNVFPASVAASYAAALARLGQESGPILLEYPLPTPDGERQYEARVVPCRPREALVVVRDVTERKASERTLHEMQADLSRLARLTALGEFAASIAHEIRQPLTGILINAKTCLRWLGSSTPDLGETRAALGDVVDAVQRADEIIRRNRELFKHRTVQKTLLDLRSVLGEVEALARSRMHAGHVTFITSVTSEVPPVLADRVELQQVLLNLIGNSIDAMESVDPRTRRIEVSSAVTPDGHVKISVRDAGIGLAGVDRDRMFALSYTTKAAGSGVGLSISRAIVEAHGGQLWAEDNTEGGATFSFTLPTDSTVSAT